MSQVARDAGLSRESLYEALSGERSPDFDTTLTVMGPPRTSSLRHPLGAVSPLE